MFIPDRTIKTMLGVIIALLAVIAASKLIEPKATAQETSTASGMVEAAWTTELVTKLKIDSKDRIKSMQVLDQANSVVVQYEDRIEFYRMRPVYVNPANVEIRKAKVGAGVAITPEIR